MTRVSPLFFLALFFLTACGGGSSDSTDAADSDNTPPTDSPDDDADTVKPDITLHGAMPLFLEQGQPYIESGAECRDAVDGDIAAVEINGVVDSSTLGQYNINYRCVDLAGNEALAVRIVHVITPSSTHLDTTITLTADTAITPTIAELVTFGLPIAEGMISSTDQIRVEQNNIALPVAVSAGMRWHWSDNSLRSVTIQLHNVDMSSGDIVLTITDDGRDTSGDLIMQPVLDGWVAAGADKAGMSYPRIFALHDTDYLADSGLIPPYAPAPAVQDDYENLVVGQYTNWSGDLDYDASRSGDWLFDRSTAYFKNYMTTGRVEFLKEAILSKQYYFTFVRNDGVEPAPPDGCWQRTDVACADGKYIAPQQAKLAWALLGDDTQWDNNLINNMARQASIGWNQYGCTADAPTRESFGFTERGCGLVGLSQVVAYEMTADAQALATLNDIRAYLKTVQQTEFSWDTAYGWLPKSGAFTHDIGVHEGVYSPGSAPEGLTDDQGFSPWMSENIADFLWQAYWITGNADIPEMLRLLGNAIDDYGFTSVYNEATGNHERLGFFTGNSRTFSCNRERADTELLYFGSAYAGDAQRSSDDWWQWYSDSHNIEVVLPLALAYYFESDVDNRTKLQARIEKMSYGWAHGGCASSGGSTLRMFNWQHRSNSIRTWDWIDAP